VKQVDIRGSPTRVGLTVPAGAGNDLDHEDRSADAATAGGVRISMIFARLHPLPDHSQPDLAGLEIDRGAPTLFGDGQDTESSRTVRRPCAHQDVHERALLGADPVLHEYVVAHLEGEGVWVMVPRATVASPMSVLTTPMPGLLLGEGISRYTADKSQDANHSDPHSARSWFPPLSGYRAGPPAFVAVSTS